jgi:hypothetical protein
MAKAQMFASQTFTGAVILLIALGLLIYLGYTSNLDWRKAVPQILFLILGAVAIDATIHSLFTTPFEYWYYWAWKAIAGSIVGIWMLKHQLSYASIITGSLAFAGLISIYYRSIELLTGYPIGTHVPDWTLTRVPITFEQNPYLSTGLWALTHTSAWLLPSLALKSMSGI